MIITSDLFKKAVITYVYDVLHSKYPEYFKIYEYDVDKVKKTAPNVYWANTQSFRPYDALTCILTIKDDYSPSLGTSGSYTVEGNKIYRNINEIHVVDIRFKISAMPNKRLGLNDLQAQNLVDNASDYLRTKLKSDSCSDWFTFGNNIATPISVVTDAQNMRQIMDVSVFENTYNCHSTQFNCVFQYMYVDKEEIPMAHGVHLNLNDGVYEEDIIFNNIINNNDKFSGDIFIIGGGQIYKELLPFCDRIYITKIFKSHNNVDTYFPILDQKEWEIVNQSEILTFNDL